MRSATPCIALLIALTLTGCGGGRAMREAQRMQRVIDESQQIEQACRLQKAQGRRITMVEATQCENDRIRQVMQESGYQYMDLTDVKLAYRLLLAERMDAGQLTEAEANMLLAELTARISREEQARNLAASLAHSQQQLAESQRLMGIGAAMQGLGILNQSFQPPPQPLLQIIVPFRR